MLPRSRCGCTGYRHPRCLHPKGAAQRAAELERVFARPTALLDGAVAVGDPIVVLPVLFHLLWRGRLVVDLAAAPLGPRSLVRAAAARRVDGWSGMTATISRPGVLRAGDEIRLDGRRHTVVALSGTSVRLIDVTGAAVVILLPQLLSDPSFELVGASRPPLAPLGALEGLPDAVLEQAHAWEGHLVEVLTGRPPGDRRGRSRQTRL